MQRRTIVRSLFAWIPLRCWRLWAQAAPFPGKHDVTLRELAATVLPESLGRAGTDEVTLQFVRWVQEYRAGAEMQTGYGNPRVRYKPVSPAPRYIEQLDQLATGALTETSVAARRRKLSEDLRAANVRELANAPDGGHIVADLMTFYFQSSEASDLAYMAEIGKDKCRTLRNAVQIPAALREVANGPLRK